MDSERHRYVPDARTLAKFDRTMAATRAALARLTAFAAGAASVPGATEFALLEDVGKELSDILPGLAREISGKYDAPGLLGAAMGMIATAAITEVHNGQ